MAVQDVEFAGLLVGSPNRKRECLRVGQALGPFIGRDDVAAYQ